MKRQDREMKDYKEIEDIINKSYSCRIAFHDKQFPYIIPMNFGYKNNTFYFHTAKTGKKIELIKQNNNVAIQIDIENSLVLNVEQAEHCTMKFQSVIAYGKASFIEEKNEKNNALNILMNQFVKDKSYNFKNKLIDAVTIFKVVCTEFTGKKNK